MIFFCLLWILVILCVCFFNFNWYNLDFNIFIVVLWFLIWECLFWLLIIIFEGWWVICIVDLVLLICWLFVLEVLNVLIVILFGLILIFILLLLKFGIMLYDVNDVWWCFDELNGEICISWCIFFLVFK